MSTSRYFHKKHTLHCRKNKQCHVFYLQVTLQECDAVDLRVLRTPANYLAAANTPEITEKIEACMTVWIKQIETVRHVSLLVRGSPQTSNNYILHLQTHEIFSNFECCVDWSSLETDFERKSII